MPTTHTVNRGECLSSIARRYGFANYRIIYDDAANFDFRKARPNPNIIYAGDKIIIPDKTLNQQHCTPGATNTFVVKHAKRTLILALQDVDGSAVADTPYKLVVGDTVIEGKTAVDGKLEKDIPWTATSATLVVGVMRRTLLIGELNPMKHTTDGGITGVQARLKNLGYVLGKIDGICGPRTKAAIMAFQARHGSQEPNGVINDELMDQLEKDHGS